MIKRRIYIVDYEPNLVSFCKMVIEDGVFEVDAFTNSFLAFLNFNHNFYDLLILDIKMPDMDGLDLYKKIRVRLQCNNLLFDSK